MYGAVDRKQKQANQWYLVHETEHMNGGGPFNPCVYRERDIHLIEMKPQQKTAKFNITGQLIFQCID